LLVNLIRKTFQLPEKEQRNTNGASSTNSKTPLAPSVSTLDVFDGQDGPITLNNDDPNEDRLNLLLGLSNLDGSKHDLGVDVTSVSGGQSPSRLSMDDVKVDVTLRTQLGQAPALMLLITDHNRGGDNAPQSVQTPRRVTICFEVGLNGQISVFETAGLVTGGIGGDSEMQGTDDSASGAEEVQKQIARVLEVSQDLGILVEWVLRWLQQRAGSG
jgi:hypothetical protein